MLTYKYDAIYCDLVFPARLVAAVAAPECQALVNRVEHRDPVLRSECVANLVFGALVEVYSRQLDAGRMEAVVEGESLEKLREQHVGV